MRLVIDTNIWLDWLVFDDPGIAPVRAAVTRGAAHVLISPACEAELERVLAYPLQRFTLDRAQQATALARCRAIATRHHPPSEAHAPAALPRCADADDQKFLELARDACAGALITKDRALLVLAYHYPRRMPFQIITPVQFSRATTSQSTMGQIASS
jgi:putative PIN family toxin of toxin-antitoxin system